MWESQSRLQMGNALEKERQVDFPPMLTGGRWTILKESTCKKLSWLPPPPPMLLLLPPTVLDLGRRHGSESRIMTSLRYVISAMKVVCIRFIMCQQQQQQLELSETCSLAAPVRPGDTARQGRRYEPSITGTNHNCRATLLQLSWAVRRVWAVLYGFKSHLHSSLTLSSLWWRQM